MKCLTSFKSCCSALSGGVVFGKEEKINEKIKRALRNERKRKRKRKRERERERERERAFVSRVRDLREK